MAILITGATGLLGRALIREAEAQNYHDIKALVLPNDPLISTLSPSVQVVYGDLLDPISLQNAIQKDDIIFHLAAYISIARSGNPLMKKINEDGTKSLVDAAISQGAKKFIYVSSSHVLAYQKTRPILESDFATDCRPIGYYEVTKKNATRYVYRKAAEGFNATVVYPSGIIGYPDEGMGEITTLLYQLAKGKLRTLVKGGYAFVDVHDVAKALLATIEQGRPGEGYTLSGGYLTIEEIAAIVRRRYPQLKKARKAPLFLAYLGLPFIALHEKIRGGKPLYTYVSLRTIQTPALFSTAKAEKELGIHFTPLEESIDQALSALEEEGKLP